MKPSEFMKSRKFISHEIYIKDLDKRFIDREELKEKINDCFETAMSKACIGAYEKRDFEKIYTKTLKKEILELLR